MGFVTTETNKNKKEIRKCHLQPLLPFPFPPPSPRGKWRWEKLERRAMLTACRTLMAPMGSVTHDEEELCRGAAVWGSPILPLVTPHTSWVSTVTHGWDPYFVLVWVNQCFLCSCNSELGVTALHYFISSNQSRFTLPFLYFLSEMRTSFIINVCTFKNESF